MVVIVQIIYRAADVIDANLAAAWLRHAGVECYVGGGFLQGGIGELACFDLHTVSVRDSDVEEATEVMAAFTKEPSAAPIDGTAAPDPT